MYALMRFFLYKSAEEKPAADRFSQKSRQVAR
jgi:hypothetical protein